MVPLNAKPVPGNYVRLVFRARQFIGCTDATFRDAVNRKIRESPFWGIANYATVTRESTNVGARDYWYTDVLVIMQSNTPSKPVWDDILDPYRNFIAGAWSCVGVDGDGITLVDANVAEYVPAPSVNNTNDAVQQNAQNQPPPGNRDQWLALGKVLGIALIAVSGAYIVGKVAGFLPKRVTA